jgi:hypothetical protein
VTEGSACEQTWGNSSLLTCPTGSTEATPATSERSRNLAAAFPQA